MKRAGGHPQDASPPLRYGVLRDAMKAAPIMKIRQHSYSLPVEKNGFAFVIIHFQKCV
jgi:hypothetical protein